MLIIQGKRYANRGDYYRGKEWTPPPLPDMVVGDMSAVTACYEQLDDIVESFQSYMPQRGEPGQTEQKSSSTLEPSDLHIAIESARDSLIKSANFRACFKWTAYNKEEERKRKMGTL